MGKLIYGVGVSEDGEFKRTYVDENGRQKKTGEYRVWKSMLDRCSSEKLHARSPVYLECSASENFRNFQYFAKWCNEQIGFGSTGWELDKDLVVKGNKKYSEDTCVFVPSELNLLLTKSNKIRGDFPIGVCFHKRSGKYQSTVKVNGTQKHLGYFNTPEEAFQVYKVAKEQFIKEQAELWKDKIDIRVYEALMKYEINIDD